MILLGIDFGTKRVGVAYSDSLGIAAHPLETIPVNDARNDNVVERLREIVQEHNIEKIIVGLPKNMDGSTGESGQKALGFGRRLRRELKLPVEMWDERLTTVEAERSMLARDMSRAKRSKRIDMIAAQLILQGYLDSQSKI